MRSENRVFPSGTVGSIRHLYRLEMKIRYIGTYLCTSAIHRIIDVLANLMYLTMWRRGGKHLTSYGSATYKDGSTIRRVLAASLDKQQYCMHAQRYHRSKSVHGIEDETAVSLMNRQNWLSQVGVRLNSPPPGVIMF